MELLGWVAASLFSPPGEALFRELAAGTLEEALEELTGHPVALPQVAPGELQAAYTALFVTHPRGLPAPPYAGYALDGELFGPSYHRLLALYREGGLEVQETWRDLPDHLAALGEAIALLNPRRPDLARRLVQEFLRPWLERYGQAVKDHDPTGFYAALVALLEEAVHAKTGVSEA
ncbi:MAG: molecular chaperone TorD family protein [Thermus sp.]|uniref:TorD/DmsD family molecular chaperone n=1 Tax=Thermus sp. TaxID=275 RepID=UPI0025FAD66A|nr:molecular chaperone TorD family protein [Thermus sp.]MCS6867429.1 molecular chaperone TorD family protein [Thermus sp.]MCS7217940.1 molecular chaperone TorD family protein [Thermus sp.]MCX7850325.1 molecular chaperone TorD family protein [Thermus sp.]MDW8016440.1 molecular chaperone TorD family protein [Thermus sp.]MDW8357244.1 molecular chaperone TorD family protein [Thermus sp.]